MKTPAWTANSGRDSVAIYIRAKDSNQPELMKSAFAGDATLEMVVNTDAISFPPFTSGLPSITDVLVTRFGETFENVRTFCLAEPPEPDIETFSCAWLVGMSERQSRAVRVGCGRYDWSFQRGTQRPAKQLRITVERMETLPPRDLSAVMSWLAALPYPWCAASVALRHAPHLEELAPIIRYLEQVQIESGP